MKIQCACGAKYAFDITPEQAQHPVQFVCPACGLDSSEYVNNLIREELGLAAPEVSGAAPVIAPAPSPVESVAAPPSAPPIPRLRLHRGGEKPAEAATPVGDLRYCPKHPGQRTTERCAVCGKPICPKCMEIFGYACSALCKGKAELQGIEMPVYAGQKALVEKRRWRKVGRMAAAAFALAAAGVGLWIWYAWFGSVPSPSFSVRFAEPAYSGASQLCGKNQIVFLHGGTLARHDLKAKKEIWSCQLIDRKQIDEQVAQTLKALHAAQDKLNNEAPDADPIKIPSPEKLAKMAEKAAAGALELRVRGENIWIVSPGKLVRHDWGTGQPAQEIPLASQAGGLIPRGDELLALGERPGKQIITHVNLATGQVRDEEFAAPAGGNLPARDPQGTELAGLPVRATGKDAGKPLDPGKVAEQASHLSLPARIALPATLSINRNQERALAEMNGQPRAQPSSAPGLETAPSFSLMPTKDGCVQFSVRLIEARSVSRKAMKEPPKKSALAGNVNMAATADVANEILNEMQRDRGGDTVTEDESRYHVIIRRPDGQDAPDWSGEVTGRPALFPLKTVNVLAANKKIFVFDKLNKKLWESALNYNVVGDGVTDQEESRYGQGPCVERGETLYVFDQGVLSAFDLKTGNARWRLPSVGVASLFFDDQEMLYVNTTTASPESIKYSRQIDLTEKTAATVMKIDPRTGRTLWTTEKSGLLTYVSGKFIYTVQSHQPEDEDDDNPYRQETGFETRPYLRIKRINPQNGRELWEHFQERAPLDVRFDRNSILLVFKKEVQVLKFLSL